MNGIELGKAAIKAAPGLLLTLWKIGKDIKESKERKISEQSLEDLIDNIDWDAEYEEYLTEEDKKNLPWWKRVCFK